ncbi:HEAT repeat domain-containing protein [Pseudoalteromonas sp. MMG012]|uniref:HEAT repeat domain-containing protein n=1 Tax=Pseudoalteromonas sp. MMG012 TaxID=2822686 RepID=UPI001B3A3CA8|nr:hypothetical protein [Pseudoalteromonas sp. MMG012]MBQ4852008.1 hypothetical protein [Pseudoalteromonas sp. MMG012]
MKLKVTLLLLALCAGCILYLTQHKEEQVEQTLFKNPISHSAPKKILQHTYSVTIESAVLAENKAVITHSSLSWHMHLGNTQVNQGLLTDIVFMNNGKPQPLTPQLPFTFNRRGTEISQVDLLALPSEHTLNVLPNILNLMSFSEQSTLTFNDAHGKKTYSYNRLGDQISRHLESRQLHSASAINDEQERWSMTLTNHDTPVEVSYSSENLWENNALRYQVIQKVHITRLNHQSTPLIAVSHDHNATLTKASQSPVAREITGPEALQDAILELKTSLDPLLAKHIGKHLLSEYDLSELVALIEEDPTASSAIIYALQKEQSPLAEQMLTDLLSTEQVNIQTKQKLLIALGRFGASSNISFNALATIADKPNSPLAKTALLNLGSMAKFTPQQQASVETFLLNSLNGEQHLGTAILAVGNSKIPHLLPTVAKLLQHPHADIQRDAVKLLSTEPHYHAQIITALLKNPTVQSVDVFARTLSDSGVVLNQQSKSRLRNLLNSTDNPIIKKRLKTLGVG